MGSIIYSDLDQTLGYSIWEGPEDDQRLVEFIVRPGAARFLEGLARHGTPHLLTLASRDYALEALAQIGSDLVAGVFAREDLEPVIEDLRLTVAAAPRRQWTVKDFQRVVSPILPRGPIFDNEPLESEYHLVKAVATGVPTSYWNEVPPFDRIHPDAGGLAWALDRFEARQQGLPRMAGRKMRVHA